MINSKKYILVKYFSIFYLISVLNVVTFNLISNYFKINSGFNNESQTVLEIFFTVVILAPLIETFLFNYTTQKFIEFFTSHKIKVILFSSIVFSIVHCYSFIYMVYSFFAGLILNLFYHYCKSNFNVTNAFWLTFLLHLAHNLTGFIILELI